jgi:hypothetical protein
VIKRGVGGGERVRSERGEEEKGKRGGGEG